MASSDHLKALIKSYGENDDTRFYTIAMQVAAREAKLGHGKLALELRALIDDARMKKEPLFSKMPVPLAKPRGELSSLLSVSYPKIKLPEMVLDKEHSGRLARILKEHRQSDKLRAHGLAARRKLLFIGPPGTGKTMSANALAGELSLPLFLVRMDSLVT